MVTVSETNQLSRKDPYLGDVLQGRSSKLEALGIESGPYLRLIARWNDTVVRTCVDLAHSRTSIEARRLADIIRRIGVNLDHGFTTRNPASQILDFFFNDDCFLNRLSRKSGISIQNLSIIKETISVVSGMDVVDPKGVDAINVATNGSIIQMGIASLRVFAADLGSREDLQALDVMFAKIRNYLVSTQHLQYQPYSSRTNLCQVSLPARDNKHIISQQQIYNPEYRFAIIKSLAVTAESLSKFYTEAGQHGNPYKLFEDLAKLFADCHNCPGILSSDRKQDKVLLDNFIEQASSQHPESVSSIFLHFSNSMQHITTSTAARLAVN